MKNRGEDRSERGRGEDWEGRERNDRMNIGGMGEGRGRRGREDEEDEEEEKRGEDGKEEWDGKNRR